MTPVEICNLALSWLGAKPIVSLEDDTTEAALCKVNYPVARDVCLERGPWSFAINRANLPLATYTPDHRWSAAFLLPSDAVRVLEVNRLDANDPTRDWAIEGRYIVLNGNECRVKYIKREEDTSVFSPAFSEAVATTLAAFLAPPITENMGLVDRFVQLAEQRVHAALAMDNQQGKARRVRSHWMAQARATGPAVAGPEV